MKWKTPGFIVHASSAEIGAYQDDFERPEEDREPFVERRDPRVLDAARVRIATRLRKE